MKRIPKLNITRIPNQPGKWRVRWYEKDADGIRHQRQIRASSKKDAEQILADKRTEFMEMAAADREEEKMERAAARRGDNVVLLSGLSAIEKMALVQAMAALRESGGDVLELADAAKEYARRHFGGRKITVGELVQAHCEWVAANRRKATYDDRRKQLRTLVGRFGKMPVSQIGTSEMRTWVEEGNGDCTRKARRRAASALFGWAMGKGLVEENPASKIRVAESTRERKEVAIFSADEAAKILQAAEEHCPALVPYYAIGFFVGARPISELPGIKAGDIDLERGVMVIHSNKTGRSRMAPISPNLGKWLEAYPVGARGVFWSKRLHNRVVAKSGVHWIQDGMRRTRASFRLAAGIHAGQVAEENGHSVAVLNAHYATRLIRREDVEKFWGLVPTSPRADAAATPRPRRS